MELRNIGSGTNYLHRLRGWYGEFRPHKAYDMRSGLTEAQHRKRMMRAQLIAYRSCKAHGGHYYLVRGGVRLEITSETQLLEVWDGS